MMAVYACAENVIENSQNCAAGIQVHQYLRRSFGRFQRYFNLASMRV
jgi:hypothetical protein